MLKLDISQKESGVQFCSLPLNWLKTSQTNQPPKPQPNTWVQLLEQPNPYSYGEALLLCEGSENEWIAWIPDHGEAVLHTEQFCIPQSAN